VNLTSSVIIIIGGLQESDGGIKKTKKSLPNKIKKQKTNKADNPFENSGNIVQKSLNSEIPHYIPK